MRRLLPLLLPLTLACAYDGVPLAVGPSALLSGGVAYVGQPYREQLPVTGGEPPYTWKVAFGTLPPGMTLTKEGVLEGTPTAATDVETVMYKVTDARGNTDSVSRLQRIRASGSVQFQAMLPPATFWQGYTAGYQPHLIGGSGPWNVQYSALPPGIALSGGATGLLSGEPSMIGTTMAAVTVTDSSGASASVTPPAVSFNIKLKPIGNQGLKCPGYDDGLWSGTWTLTHFTDGSRTTTAMKVITVNLCFKCQADGLMTITRAKVNDDFFGCRFGCDTGAGSGAFLPSPPENRSAGSWINVRFPNGSDLETRGALHVSGTAVTLSNGLMPPNDCWDGSNGNAGLLDGMNFGGAGCSWTLDHSQAPCP